MVPITTITCGMVAITISTAKNQWGSHYLHSQKEWTIINSGGKHLLVRLSCLEAHRFCSRKVNGVELRGQGAVESN